mgnify:CR=1 FL=1
MIDFIDEYKLYYYSLITWVIIAVIIFIILVSFKNLKTYGRHVPKKGVLLNNRLGWFLMEIPTLILMPYFIYSGTKTINTVIFCFLGLYMLHYFNRTIIFPFRLKFKKNKEVFRRQDAPKYYDITTVGYVTRPDFILTKKNLFSGKVKSIIVPKERAIDIDDLTDALIAEFLYERRKKFKK